MSPIRPERAAAGSVADMSGPPALPRRSGEIAFHDEWERRVFALAVALCEQGHYEWDEFREYLVAAIAEVGETPENPRHDAPGYFEHWLASFEKLLADKGTAPAAANAPQRPHLGDESP